MFNFHKHQYAYRFRIYIHVCESTQTSTVNKRPAAKLAISIKLNPYLKHIAERVITVRESFTYPYSAYKIYLGYQLTIPSGINS